MILGIGVVDRDTTALNEGRRRPAAASIASFASRSACAFCSRGTCSNRIASNRDARTRASACSGCNPGCLTRYSPRICFTTSSESERIRTRRWPFARAHSSAARSPRYSATLFVATPMPSWKSVISVPSVSSTRTPKPAGPGFPRDPPSM
jgi:hypothetical protein